MAVLVRTRQGPCSTTTTATERAGHRQEQKTGRRCTQIGADELRYSKKSNSLLERSDSFCSASICVNERSSTSSFLLVSRAWSSSQDISVIDGQLHACDVPRSIGEEEADDASNRFRLDELAATGFRHSGECSVF